MRVVGDSQRINWRAVGWLTASLVAILLSLQIIRASLNELNRPPNPERLISVPAEIIESRVEARMVSSTNAQGSTSSALRHSAIVRYQYQVGANRFTCSAIGRHDPSSSEAWARAAAGKYPIGKQVAAYYDRLFPQSAVLVPGYGWVDWGFMTISFAPMLIACPVFAGALLDLFRRAPSAGSIVHVRIENGAIDFGLAWTPTFAWGGGVCAAVMALGSVSGSMMFVEPGLTPRAFWVLLWTLFGISLLLGVVAALVAHRLRAATSNVLRLHRDTAMLHVPARLQTNGEALHIPTRLIRSIHIASEWFRLDRRQICESRTMVEWEEAGKRFVAAAGLFHSYESAQRLAAWLAQELGARRGEDRISAAGAGTDPTEADQP